MELRHKNVELNQTIGELETALDELTKRATEEALASLIQAWHENNWKAAEQIAALFGDGTRENIAASFLLDKGSLAEKISGIRQALQRREPCFLEFIVAEHFLRENNTQEAIAAYRRCLLQSEASGKDQWLIRQARSRLYEITVENQQAGVRLDIEGGGER